MVWLPLPLMMLGRASACWRIFGTSRGRLSAAAVVPAPADGSPAWARACTVFTLISRGGRRRRHRLGIGDAGIAFQRFARRAPDRADASPMLGQFSDERLCNVR